MKKLIFIALCYFTNSIQSQYFEGVVEYKSTSKTGEQNYTQNSKHFYSGNGYDSRNESNTEEGQNGMISITRGDTIYLLNEGQSTANYIIKDNSSNKTYDIKYKRTSETKTIQGFKCVKYIVTGTIYEKSEAYFAEGIITSKKTEGFPNFLLLKQITYFNNNSYHTTIATSVSEKKMNNSLFTIPSNYTCSKIKVRDVTASQIKKKKKRKSKEPAIKERL